MMLSVDQAILQGLLEEREEDYHLRRKLKDGGTVNDITGTLRWQPNFLGSVHERGKLTIGQDITGLHGVERFVNDGGIHLQIDGPIWFPLADFEHPSLQNGVKALNLSHAFDEWFYSFEYYLEEGRLFSRTTKVIKPNGGIIEETPNQGPTLEQARIFSTLVRLHQHMEKTAHTIDYLEHWQNLTSLSVAHGVFLNNLDVLKRAAFKDKLEHLDASYSNISSIDFLPCLSSLTHLRLDHDLSHRYVDIGYNPHSFWTFYSLGTTPPRSGTFDPDEVHDFSPLKSPNLEKKIKILGLSGTLFGGTYNGTSNPDNGLNLLTDYESLQELNVSYTGIDDPSTLLKFKSVESGSLRYVAIGGNGIDWKDRKNMNVADELIDKGIKFDYRTYANLADAAKLPKIGKRTPVGYLTLMVDQMKANNDFDTVLIDLKTATSRIKVIRDERDDAPAIIVKEADAQGGKNPYEEELAMRDQLEKIVGDDVLLPKPIDTFEFEGRFYYVMKREKGETLTDRIKSGSVPAGTYDKILKTMARIHVLTPTEDRHDYPLEDIIRQRLGILGADPDFMDKHFTPVTDALKNSEHICYYNDSHTDNWLIGEDGKIILLDTGDLGNVPYTADLAYFLNIISNPQIDKLDKVRKYIDYVNDVCDQEGRPDRRIDNPNLFMLEYCNATIARVVTGAEYMSRLGRPKDSKDVLQAGIEMADYMLDNEIVESEQRAHYTAIRNFLREAA